MSLSFAWGQFVIISLYYSALAKHSRMNQCAAAAAFLLSAWRHWTLDVSHINRLSVIFTLRELELSSMSGPLERQSIHIPEPERSPLVMAVPACTRSPFDRPTAVWFALQDRWYTPPSWVCPEQTIRCEKGTLPHQTGNLTSDLTVAHVPSSYPGPVSCYFYLIALPHFNKIPPFK